MFNGRYTFDTMTVAKDSYVFASEYAVFDWGISTIPRGNIQVRSPLPCHFKSCHAQVMTLCLVWVLYPYSEAMVVILSIFVFLPDQHRALNIVYWRLLLTSSRARHGHGRE